MNPRQLNFANTVNLVLNRNNSHVFAQQHALNLYSQNTIFTYIPKNACSTLRLSLAIANGCIESPDELGWIHQNNQTFVASLSELIKAEYTFTFLRCPFRRLASVFLDKIISKDKVAWSYYENTEKKIELDNLNFAKFVKSLRYTKVLMSNHHWRPQKDFLVYRRYDDYFCVEDMTSAITTLKSKIDFSIVDAREQTKHGTDGFEVIDTVNFAQYRARHLYAMKLKNTIPSYKSLYNEELIDLVASIYKEDIALYSRECDSSNMLFQL
jgi:hypothetical protein